jgi:hypothetical protein
MAGLQGRLNHALVDPQYRSRLGKRTLEVLRTEGVGGVLRRISKRP